MQQLKTQEAGGQPFSLAPETGKAIPVLRDRSVPGWVSIFSYVFTFGISACVLAVAVMALFFQTLVAQEGQLLLSPLLAMGGAVCVFGILLLEFAHSRALAGYCDDRRRFAQRAQGWIGGAIALVLAMVHPLLALPVIAGGALNFGGLALLRRYGRGTPLWDYNASEAVGVLSGRDLWGMWLASGKARLPEMAQPLHLANVVLAGLTALAIASWLAGQDILAPHAVAAVTLIALWAAHSLGQLALLRAEADPSVAAQSNSVAVLNEAFVEDEDTPDEGLCVRSLSVAVPNGRALLADVSFDLEPGTVTGVIGDTGGGKTLMLRALADPYALGGLDVKGMVSFNGADLWMRRSSAQTTPAVYLPNEPLILPTSGLENLTCFHGELVEDRGRRVLEQLVFSTYAVDEICNAKDATLLPGTQKRCLALARGFLLSPDVYFLDRPEDGLPEKQVSALLGQISHETRLGRSVVMVTDNRALLEACDKLIVLQEGRMVDFGDAAETRARRSTGWMRFVAARRLETEDNLDTWIRSHFKRDGDDANRRKICMVASEMLAFSCQNAEPRSRQMLSFEFKHFAGHCLLKLQDQDDPVSTVQLEKARAQAAGADAGTRLSPLAAIMRACLEVEATVEMDRRVLVAKIETYDPRLSSSKKRSPNESQA